MLLTRKQLYQDLGTAYFDALAQQRVETVQDVLAPDLDGFEPRLTRLGYPVKSLCEALNARPAEICAFLRGRRAVFCTLGQLP